MVFSGFPQSVDVDMVMFDGHVINKKEAEMPVDYDSDLWLGGLNAKRL